MSLGVAYFELVTEIARKHARAPNGRISVIQVIVDNLDAAHSALAALCALEEGRLFRASDADLVSAVPGTTDPFRRAAVSVSMTASPTTNRRVEVIEVGDGRLDVVMVDPPALIPSPGEQAVLSISRAVLHRDLDQHRLVVITYREHVIDLPFRRAVWALAADQLNGMPHPTLKTVVFVVEAAISVRLHCQTGRGFQLAFEGERLLYRRGLEDLRASAGQIARHTGRLVLFLGAGFSQSSRLPLGNDMRDAAIKRLLSIGEEVPSPTLARRFHQWASERDWLLPHEKQLPQDAFVDSLTLERVILAERRVNPDLPSLADFRAQHDRIVADPGPAVRDLCALLPAAQGRIVLIAVNFDQLIEKNSPVQVVVFASESQFAGAPEYLRRYFAGEESAIPLLKLHGTIEDLSTCVVSMEQTELGIGDAKLATLRALLDSSQPPLWLYVGASLRDLDLRPVLLGEDFGRGLDERFVLPYLPLSVHEFGSVREPIWRLHAGFRNINDRLITETADAFFHALRETWAAQSQG